VDGGSQIGRLKTSKNTAKLLRHQAVVRIDVPRNAVTWLAR
jgi:hypothetical protein